MDDVRAIMDAVGSKRATLFGHSEGCPMSVLFAATYPERARLVNISTYPNNLCPRAWSGTDDKALVNFASAAAKAAVGSVTKKFAPSRTSRRADPISASMLWGSADNARIKKAARLR
jgi:pimeloyl-ACP methyl ester carboxylesterase